MARDADENRNAANGANQAGQAKAEILGRFNEAISGMSLGELTKLLQDLGAFAAPDLDPFAEEPPPSRRRPRRADVVTYRVRVDLAGTKPPLWRRLELASDLFLDDVHEVIQAVFGWTDSHLHRFGCGPQYYSRDTEFYLCPFEVDEGETGVPEEEVRLDEVLVEAGDKLYYTYDFGDDWQHTIRLESVRPREESAPRAICTGGRRDGPAEDCGGVPGYELIAAATDPTHPGHAETAAEFARVYGDDVDPADLAPTPFDIGEVNDVLADVVAADPGAGGPTTEIDLPEPVAELVDAVRSTTDRRRLRQLIGGALHEPARVDAETAARMVRPYAWLLDRVGTDGIKLTSAGYLPPAHVEAAMNELDLWDEWIGKGNREDQTLPILDLRQSAQTMGLLRKYRGRLLLSARGRTARTDPLALWWQLAERMPPASKDVCKRQAGLLLLIAMAAETADDLGATVARFLGAIGWINGDGTRLTGSMALRATWDTRAVLRRLGGFSDERGLHRSQRPTADGVSFARAALATWPADNRRTRTS